MDKAPDAFRTISEVSDDLDIPQHVLRFWETRFTQIKPMKRSGGRRYYRPDDVELLRGIRRLLYGEGYTIRGVQRILREHGIKAVQSLDDRRALEPASFAEPSFDEGVDGHAFDDGGHDDARDEIDAPDDADEAPRAGRSAEMRLERHGREPEIDVSPRFDGMRRPDPVVVPTPVKTVVERSSDGPTPLPSGAEAYAPPNVRKAARPLDRDKLQAVLDDLLSARSLIDRVLKDDDKK